MQIITQRINSVTINFIQDLSEDTDDITPLVSSLPKLKTMINEPGYKNKFNKDEKELWNNFIKEIQDSIEIK